MNCPYRIYDNYNEEWVSVSFAEFEDAEKYMHELSVFRDEHDMPIDFDIYEKIT